MPSQRPWPFSNPFHNAHAHASALSPLQQASVAGSGSDGSPDRMAEVNEALKKQVSPRIVAAKRGKKVSDIIGRRSRGHAGVNEATEPAREAVDA